jgi:hypothetical protein
MEIVADLPSNKRICAKKGVDHLDKGTSW